jgi:hypothetical protein
MSVSTNIRPLPEKFGVGFTSNTPVENVNGYAYEAKGKFHHNYKFTPQNYAWPVQYEPLKPFTIDAFAPNLNKFMHVGHLRQLVLANALHHLHPNSRFVGMLGKALGVVPGAMEQLLNWCEWLNYFPAFYADTDLKVPKEIEDQFYGGTGEHEGCQMFKGSEWEAVVTLSKQHKPKVGEPRPGEHTYTYHDLAFASVVNPDFYLTAYEQKKHFHNLGLGEKHLAMGLVLDPNTGKKMKSRTGDAFPAAEAMDQTVETLKRKETDKNPDYKRLAYNVLAWNFLRVGRESDVAFDPDDWTEAKSGGMYITYTTARVYSALEKAGLIGKPLKIPAELENNDVDLIGYANYSCYWKNLAAVQMDPAPLANFTHDLARKLGNAYHAEPIVGGRHGFQAAVFHAYEILVGCVEKLGMTPMTGV